jgi:hypothetical protein
MDRIQSYHHLYGKSLKAHNKNMQRTKITPLRSTILSADIGVMNKEECMLNTEDHKNEKKAFFVYLNTILGGFSVTIALACLSTENPALWLLLSLPFVLGLVVIGYRAFPESLKQLRGQGNNNVKAKELSNHVEKEEYGFLVMLTDLFPCFYGYLFYLGVLIYAGIFMS